MPFDTACGLGTSYKVRCSMTFIGKYFSYLVQVYKLLFSAINMIKESKVKSVSGKMGVLAGWAPVWNASLLIPLFRLQSWNGMLQVFHQECAGTLIWSWSDMGPRDGAGSHTPQDASRWEQHFNNLVVQGKLGWIFVPYVMVMWHTSAGVYVLHGQWRFGLCMSQAASINFLAGT